MGRRLKGRESQKTCLFQSCRCIAVNGGGDTFLKGIKEAGCSPSNRTGLEGFFIVEND
jgi:hypothetical protein